MKTYTRFTYLKYALWQVAFGIICLFPASKTLMPMLNKIDKILSRMEG